MTGGSPDGGAEERCCGRSENSGNSSNSEGAGKRLKSTFSKLVRCAGKGSEKSDIRFRMCC